MTSVAVRPETEESGRLFEEYSGQLLAYCARQLGSRSEAEDAVQTTFLYALRALRRGVVPECEAAWLTTIARNVCHWQRRTRDRRGPLASDIDLGTIGPAQPEGDEEGVLEGLKDALASMPENQRHAIVLRELQGVPAGEIASQLGMSRPATYALLTRARRSLAHALTVARRPVLGLAWLVVELRSHVKAFLGGVSAKAAAAAAAAVVGVGGVALERSLDEPKAPSAPVQVVNRSAVESNASASTVRPMPAPGPTPGVAPVSARAPRTEAARPLVGFVDPSTVPTWSLPNAGEPAGNPETGGEVLPPALELSVDLPDSSPRLPAVEPPMDLLPPVELPSLPPVDLPPVDPPSLPPVDLPQAPATPLPVDEPLPGLSLP